MQTPEIIVPEAEGPFSPTINRTTAKKQQLGFPNTKILTLVLTYQQQQMQVTTVGIMWQHSA